MGLMILLVLSIVVAQSNHDHGLYDSTIFKDL